MITKVVEEYIEAIYTLERKNNIANTTHIATLLDLKPASVTEMLKKLHDMNLIEHRPYRGARLTRKGFEIAEDLTNKHKTFAEFFKLIGVKEEIAELDACHIEHFVTHHTIKKLKKFLKEYKK